MCPPIALYLDGRRWALLSCFLSLSLLFPFFNNEITAAAAAAAAAAAVVVVAAGQAGSGAVNPHHPT